MRDPLGTTGKFCTRDCIPDNITESLLTFSGRIKVLWLCKERSLFLGDKCLSI